MDTTDQLLEDEDRRLRNMDIAVATGIRDAMDQLIDDLKEDRKPSQEVIDKIAPIQSLFKRDQEKKSWHVVNFEEDKDTTDNDYLKEFVWDRLPQFIRLSFSFDDLRPYMGYIRVAKTTDDAVYYYDENGQVHKSRTHIVNQPQHAIHSREDVLKFFDYVVAVVNAARDNTNYTGCYRLVPDTKPMIDGTDLMHGSVKIIPYVIMGYVMFEDTGSDYIEAHFDFR